MPTANVKTRWIDGDLVFYDKDANEIFRVDGTNRKVTFPAGSVLDLGAAAGILLPAAGEIVAADLEEGVQRITDVTITSAQVLALNATPITLIAAPAANKAIVFDGAVIHKPAGTAYGGVAAGEDLGIKYTGSAGLEVAACEMTGFADSAGAQTRFILPRTGALAAGTVSDLTVVANAVLVAHMLVGEIITGTSDFKFRVYYRIVPTVV